MKALRILNLLIFIVFGSLCSVAVVRNLNVRDGLSSRLVYEITDDPDGFVWIYTNSGLDRFDGYTMKHYPIEPEDEHSDHIQSATSMNVDSDGLLWIALKAGNIYRYNREYDRFDCVISFNDPSVQIKNFIIDDDKNIIVCTNSGLFRCSPDGGQRKIALGDKFVRTIISDGDNGWLVGTDHGLYHILHRSGGYKVEFIECTKGIHVLSLAVSSGNIYIGSFAHGLFMLTPAGHLEKPLPDIPPMPVNAIKAYGSDSLFAGVDGAGVYLINTVDNSLRHHYHDSDDNDGFGELSSNSVTDIHVDRNNGIWVGTSHNGLNYISAPDHAVKTIRSRNGRHDAIVSDYVNVVYEDSDGDIWFGTDKGASRYSPAINRWWHYLRRNNYVASDVLSFGEDSRGRILVGTYGNGLTIVDKATGSETRLPVHEPGKSSGLGTAYVFAGFGTKNGKIWIGGINGPLTCYDIADDSYTYYDEDCVATIISDKKGELFGGNKGVGRYDKTSDSFEWTQTFDSIQIRYPVRALLADTVSDEMWIATQGDGLVRYNCAKNTAVQFTTADGLNSNAIYSLAADKNGCVWICTETDLYRVNKSDNKLTRFTDLLGTDIGVFNAAGATTTRDGTIMLGTAEGCVAFDPVNDFKNNPKGKLLFTDFRMQNRAVNPGDPGSPLLKNINITDGLKLLHNQNSLDIGYVIINYALLRSIGVEYFLEGYEAAPHIAGASGRIRYSDIPPGNYTLRLKAIDRYNGEPFEERAISVKVMPPVWLRPWAIVLYVLAGMGLFVFAWISIRRIRHNRHIESQLRSYAAIAHDIRTPMSMVKAPLMNVELDSGLSESARTNLRQARAGIDKTIGLLDELLGLRREISGQRRLQVQKVDILRYLRVKVEEYSSLAIFKGIGIEYNVSPELSAVTVDPDKFDHIVDNLLSNAIKYTNKGNVILSAYPSGRRRWCFSVTDTGIGMSPEDARHVFRHRHRSQEAAGCDSSGTGLGLLITRRLVGEHKGKITFTSEHGKGSTFAVELPLHFAKSCYVLTEIEQQPANVEETVGDSAQSASKQTIFIIDDDKDILSFLSQNLGDEYNILTSGNAANALAEIKEKNPDLVISDIMMPQLRGDELCRMLKTNIDTSHIPVILLTGLAGRADIVAGLEASADDYVIKPFDIVVLQARIRNILRIRKDLGSRILADDCTPSQEEFTNELDRRFMTRTMELIDENMSNSEYSVNDLCSDLAMSRTSVYNKIKSLTGQSPNEFMRIMSLNKAKELLSTHKYNISEVAYMVGFSDPKYFSTCFKKQFGTSPSKI